MSSYSHFLIKLVGAGGIQTRKAGDFLFVPRFKALVYQGRAIPLAEFNDLVPKVMERYKDYMPRLPQIVMLTEAEAAEPVKPVVLKAEPTVESTTLSPDPVEPLVSEGVSQSEQTEVEDTEAAGEGSPDPEPAAEAPAPKPAKKKAAKKG